MKNLVFIFLCFYLGVKAQHEKPDTIKTSKGPLVIQPIQHAAMVLTWNNKTIYVDPYGGKKAYEGIKAPDIILITDIHQDHMNIETLEAIGAGSVSIVMPYAVAKHLPKELNGKGISVGNGKEIIEKGITIKTIPMYNLPESPDARHTKGRGNAYILELGDKRIYISGDTEDIPEMRKLKNIDIAFVCMNLPYTMDINQAASAVLDFVPKIVYPYHYRGQEGMSDIEGFKKLVNKSNGAIDVRLRNWYAGF